MVSDYRHEPAAAQEVDFRVLWGVLSRRWRVVGLTVLVVVTAALAISSTQSAIYESRINIALQPAVAAGSGSGNSDVDPEQALQAEMGLILGPAVASNVEGKLGRPAMKAGKMTAPTDDGTGIALAVRGTDSKQVTELANAYGAGYLEVRRQTKAENLRLAVETLQASINNLQQQINDIDVQISRNPLVLADRLGPQRSALVDSQIAFRQRIQQLQVDAALERDPKVTPATTPGSPISPKPKRNAVVGLAAGLVIGLGLAFLIDHADDSIKTDYDLERAAEGVSVVGVIPLVPAWAARRQNQPLARAGSPAGEAYRSLRTALKLHTDDGAVRIVQITSSVPGEGKSTTAVNLGFVLARGGQRTVIVDCDLRKPRLHDYFKLSNRTGFTSVVTGEMPLSGALHRFAAEPHLLILPSGPLPRDPAELLASKRAADVLAALGAQADIVIVDSPPVLPVTDAVVLSGYAHTTLLVVGSGTGSTKHVRRALKTLRHVDASLAGTVLNAAESPEAYGYGYGYGPAAMPPVEARASRREVPVGYPGGASTASSRSTAVRSAPPDPKPDPVRAPASRSASGGMPAPVADSDPALDWGDLFSSDDNGSSWTPSTAGNGSARSGSAEGTGSERRARSWPYDPPPAAKSGQTLPSSRPSDEESDRTS